MYGTNLIPLPDLTRQIGLSCKKVVVDLLFQVPPSLILVSSHIIGRQSEKSPLKKNTLDQVS